MTAMTAMLLDPGMNLTLRPMRYPMFYDRFRDAIKNTWTVEEVDLHTDLADLKRLSPAERHLVSRLVAFFATGDTIVANNLVLNLYQHVNSPEGRLYLSRQLFRTAWELPQRALIDLAAARSPFIDQSQSLNLFLAAPTIGKLSSMYLHAWKRGLKTTYYLRSRPATRIQQATVSVAAPDPNPDADRAADEYAAALACSLENPETCEACQ